MYGVFMEVKVSVHDMRCLLALLKREIRRRVSEKCFNEVVAVFYELEAKLEELEYVEALKKIG